MQFFNIKHMVFFIMLLHINYSFAMPEITYTTNSFGIEL